MAITGTPAASSAAITHRTHVGIDFVVKATPRRVQWAVAFAMFGRNATVDEVALQIERAHSTVWGYLSEFIVAHPDHPLDAWVPPETAQAIADAAASTGVQYLRPIFDKLEGAVGYDAIRMVVTRLKALSAS